MNQSEGGHMKKLIVGVIVSLLLVACSPTPQNTNNTPQGSNNTGNNQTIDEPIPSDDVDYSFDNVREFDLDIELLTGRDIEFDYDNRREPSDEIAGLLGNIEINLERSLNDMMDDVLDHLEIARDEVNEFELQLDLVDSKEIDFKYNREERNQDRTVVEFNLEIDFNDRSEWNFEYELNDDYEIEGRENLQGNEAKTRIEALIEAMNVSMDMTPEEVGDAFMNHLELNRDDVREFDLDIEYRDASEIDVKVRY